jgi:pimeloyl-ACP methyl ester carboxylesterase
MVSEESPSSLTTNYEPPINLSTWSRPVAASFWIGVALLLSVPVSVTLLLVALYIILCRNYLHYVVRIFQEKPLFIIPRGQPVPGAEDVTMTTADGLRLKATYFKTAKPRKGVILFGLEFGSNRWACVPYCEHLLADGYDIFTFESRNQGDSDHQPNYDALQWVTQFEVRDMRTALGYLKARPDAHPCGIGFFGISKGAGAALVAFAHEPYVRCFATDGLFATYTTLVPYMRQWFRIYNSRYALQGLLPSWYYGIIGKHGLRIVERQRKCRFAHLERILTRRLASPLLMIHGSADTYIKPEMARALFDRMPDPKEFWLVEGAKHNQALQKAADAYRGRVLDFFNAHLATQPERDVSCNGTGNLPEPGRESRTDSPVVPIAHPSPVAPAGGDSPSGIGDWGSGTQLSRS